MDKWKNRTIADGGGYNSEDFLEFAKDFKKFLFKELQSVHIDLNRFNVGHHEVSGFFLNRTTNKFGYFSISDVRYFPNDWHNNIMVRSVTGYGDYKGGTNNWSSLSNFAETAERITQ